MTGRWLTFELTDERKMVGHDFIYCIPFLSKSVSGSFGKGCGMPLKNLVDRRLLCPVTQPHTSLCFAVSDLKDRFRTESREIALGHTEEMMRERGGFGEHPYDFKVFAHRRYGTRCQVNVFNVVTEYRFQNHDILPGTGGAPGRGRARDQRL